jgi:hypothetical protein
MCDDDSDAGVDETCMRILGLGRGCMGCLLSGSFLRNHGNWISVLLSMHFGGDLLIGSVFFQRGFQAWCYIALFYRKMGRLLSHAAFDEPK